ncbi:hypothetical protein [Streptomyces sp. NBC_00102]|uniref:hypothetical protein n=1 Tax=Streptomyces sp. NBC_00102 TaxID=2975652 RepID=UPI0022566301|nr:hypothetical protein [Streptomyces sp. NBC_00102]MCX5398842.1 hypothetical protein [Streptomyces sp. NBC_00102]
MTDEVAAYHYLWDGSEDGWVVLRTRVALGTIFNTRERVALVIEDDAVYARVIQLMSTHGRPFLDTIPPE